jgi:hypothetical protein
MAPQASEASEWLVTADDRDPPPLSCEDPDHGAQSTPPMDLDSVALNAALLKEHKEGYGPETGPALNQPLTEYLEKVLHKGKNAAKRIIKDMFVKHERPEGTIF